MSSSGCLRLVSGGRQDGNTTSHSTVGQTTESTSSAKTTDATAGENAAVHSFSLDTNEYDWSHSVSRDAEQTQIVSVDSAAGRVVFAAGSDDLPPAVTALDSKTGDALWTFELENGHVTDVLTTSDVTYVAATQSGHLLDSKSGERLQTYEHGPGFHSFVSDESTAYVIGDNGPSFAFDLTARKKMWEVELPRSPDDSPVVGERTVYFGSTAGYVYAIGLDTGNVEWESRIDGSIDGKPSLTNDLLWVPSKNNTIHALKRETGEVVRNFDPELRDQLVSVVGMDDLLCLSGQSERYAYAVTSRESASSLEISEAWDYPSVGVPECTRRGIVLSGTDQLHGLDERGEVAFETGAIDDGRISLLHGDAVSWGADSVFVGARTW